MHQQVGTQTQRDAGRYHLQLGEIHFECDPAEGGRITAFGPRGNNFLIESSVHPENYGSTFWSSPQIDWGWPPPFELDRAPCKATVTNGVIELVGRPCDRLGLCFVKRFAADRESRGMVLQYVIENVGASARRVAPWEVSRVHPGGLTFFPGVQAPAGCGLFPPLQTCLAAGATWFAHNPDRIDGEHKLFGESSRGWIAHLAGDFLFIKAFPAVPAEQQAPGEAGIEIFACAGYVEVEQQGAWVSLAPGESLSWTVRWYVRPLPRGTARIAGSLELIELAERTAAGR